MWPITLHIIAAKLRDDAADWRRAIANGLSFISAGGFQPKQWLQNRATIRRIVGKQAH
jgi:hypothetical protein